MGPRAIRLVCLAISAVGGGIFGIGVYHGIQKPLEQRFASSPDEARWLPDIDIDDDDLGERLARVEEEIGGDA